MVIMSDLEQNFKEINWINSNTALEYIGLNDEEIIKVSREISKYSYCSPKKTGIHLSF